MTILEKQKRRLVNETDKCSGLKEVRIFLKKSLNKSGLAHARIF
jgi:hypothetical protein